MRYLFHTLLVFVTVIACTWFGVLHGLAIGAAVFLLMPHHPSEIAVSIVNVMMKAKEAGRL